MTGGTAAPGGGLRQMPSSRKGLPTRRDLATGVRRAQGGVKHTAFDIVGGVNDARLGLENRQRELGAPAPRRQVEQPRYDLSGMLISGSSRTRKEAFGETAETNAKRARIGVLADQSQATPTIGTNGTGIAELIKGQEGLVQVANGIDAHAQVDARSFIRGQNPSTRQPGSGGLIWGGFPALPDTPFDRNYQNQGPGGAVYPGTSSNEMFIDLGDRNQLSRVANNPLNNASFSVSATSKMETNTLTGEPRAVLPITHRVSDSSQDLMPEEQRFLLMFAAVKVVDNAKGTIPNEYETRAAPLPFHDLYNLTALNMLIAAGQNMPRNRGDVPSAQDLLGYYNLLGPVRAETGSKLSPQGYTPGNRKQRNIISVPQGEADVFNIWGHDLQIHQPVYLILKGVPLNTIQPGMGAPNGSYNIHAQNPSYAEKLPEDEVSPVPLQFVPWYDKTGFKPPSMTDLAYIGPLGQQRFGVAIRVGIVMQHYPHLCPDEVRARAPFSVHSTMQCGKIRISVDKKIMD